MIFIFGDILKPESIKKNEPLKDHCSFKTGGLCEFFLIPENSEELIAVVKRCRERNFPFFIVGNGSNILFTDEFHKGAYISLSKLNGISEKDGIITAEAGVKLSELCGFAAKEELSGLEELSGIPGTVGGAVFMNAGAYGGEIKDTLIKSIYIGKNSEIAEINASEHKFGYRRSVFQENGGIILSSQFRLKKGNKEEIKKKTIELLKKRSDKQPLNYPSAGSTFKRPEGYFAGKLIEDSGLSGFSVGEAEVSEKHCGFVINKGGASSSDIIALIKHIQKTVYEKYGVMLETEVKII